MAGARNESDPELTHRDTSQGVEALDGVKRLFSQSGFAIPP